MTQQFEEYDVVALKRALPSISLPPGTKGTIVHVNSLVPPGAYIVEFMEGKKTLGVLDVTGDNLELVVKYEK